MTEEMKPQSSNGKETPRDSVGTRSSLKPPAFPVKAIMQKRLQPRSTGTIVPRESVAGRTLLVVIAIMAFLACLTVGAVSIVNQTANSWQNDINREVTIQIRPSNEVDMSSAIRQASRIALSYPGVTKVRALTDEATKRLLEPWLGSGLKLDELPVPRLLMVTLDGAQTPDFASMREELRQSVPGTSLDDHSAWADRLSNMAWSMVIIGIIIFMLVTVATGLTVIFATTGALAANNEVVEVLHFVGANKNFIAKQFQRHFLILSLQGAVAGGFVAILFFLIVGFWTNSAVATPEGDQITALFGRFDVSWAGYAGMISVIMLICVVATITSRWTVSTKVLALEKIKNKR